MTTIREPRLHPIAIRELRPTQMTVGMREVAAKVKHWREVGHKNVYLGTHTIPVVHGLKERYYVIDHHHLAYALQQAGVKTIAVTVVADLRRLKKSTFWSFMEARGWTHPYDSGGKRCDHAELPRRITGLVDDPYRSLAGELRHMGGFAKDVTPFSEFLWADFLRLRIKRHHIDKDFSTTLAKALELAKSLDADYLPGWCGPVQRH